MKAEWLADSRGGIVYYDTSVRPARRLAAVVYSPFGWIICWEGDRDGYYQTRDEAAEVVERIMRGGVK